MLRHVTPFGMDEFLEREEITRQEYAEFWSGYWASRNKQSYLEQWMLSPVEVEEEEVSPFAAFWKSLG